jgi:hypothetical protein
MDEKRRARRVDWAGKVALTTLARHPLASGTIGNLSDGGVLIVNVSGGDTLAVGQRLRFELDVPDGEVEGSVEVARIETAPDGRRVGLRMLTITNDGGLHRLLAFLHRCFAGA